MALTILSGISTTEFADAIANGDADMLVRLPGIGKKTAQRLLIEMKDPLAKLDLHGVAGQSQHTSSASSAQEAFSALQALGYKDAEIRRLLKNVQGEGVTTENMIRQALRSSAK